MKKSNNHGVIYFALVILIIVLKHLLLPKRWAYFTAPPMNIKLWDDLKASQVQEIRSQHPQYIQRLKNEGYYAVFDFKPALIGFDYDDQKRRHTIVRETLTFIGITHTISVTPQYLDTTINQPVWLYVLNERLMGVKKSYLVKPLIVEDLPADSYFIARGLSHRGKPHSIVMHKRLAAFDPHPTAEGLKEIHYYYYFKSVK